MVAALALGCGTSTSEGDSVDEVDFADVEGAIEVPDLAGGDGADAVTSIDGEGLTAALADAGNDPAFDPSRDATGCDVVDQDPGAGEALSDGDEVTITVDCRQIDWENQEGTDWESFSEGYSAGFDDGCQALFDTSPNGSLYENDIEYGVLDCQGLNPGDGADASDFPPDVPDDAEADGQEVGELDGCQALFEQEGLTSLTYATDSITDLDCPLTSPSRSSSSGSDRSNGRGTSRSEARSAGGTCVGTQTDGTAIRARITKGKVNCKGAEALWNEFLRRAPNEGTGSGGFVELDGWGCIGARVPQAPRLGTCERTDDSAAFTISETK